jgi:hypothetical protein
VEADPVSLVSKVAPQSRRSKKALMMDDKVGRRAHSEWKLRAAVFADGACTVQCSHELEDSAGVVAEAKLRRELPPQGCRAHGCSLLRQLLEQLDSTLRNAAQWSVSDPHSGTPRCAGPMPERRNVRPASVLRGVACGLNGDLKLK